MSLDPKRLLELLSIAECGSYTKAAAALKISQPALTSSIKSLERTLNARVLERGQAGSHLTDFGRVLLPQAKAIRAAIDRARSDVTQRKLGVDGTLTIGATPAACGRLVAASVSRLVEKTPAVAVSIIEDIDDRLVSSLRAGELELIVSPLRSEPDKADLEDEALLADPFFVVMPKRHPLAHYKSVSLKQLRGMKWILPSPHTVTAREIESIFSIAGVNWPSDAITCNSIAAIVEMIDRTSRVSIMSRQLALMERNAARIAWVPLRNAKPARNIGIRRRKGAELSPVAIHFISLARQVAGELERLR